jgi:hypothetical protein
MDRLLKAIFVIPVLVAGTAVAASVFRAAGNAVNGTGFAGITLAGFTVTVTLRADASK